MERYTYSNNGILLKHVEYPEETDQKNYSKKIVLYNNKERTVEELYYDIGGLLITKKMFSYNEHMDIIKETVFDANNSVLYGTAYEYVYDDKGNLVKQIELKRVSEFGEIYYKPIFVIIQKIVYYE